MGYTTTPVNGMRVPDRNEKLADIWKAEGILAQDLETRINMRFANMLELANKLSGDFAPVDGMFVYVAETKQYLGRVNGAWKVFSVGQPQIYTGSTAPAASLGAVGDIYFQV